MVSLFIPWNSWKLEIAKSQGKTSENRSNKLWESLKINLKSFEKVYTATNDKNFLIPPAGINDVS